MDKDLIAISQLTRGEITALIRQARAFKRDRARFKLGAKRKVLALIFEKESTRTRISFEVAIQRLGGTAIYLGRDATQLSRGETYADTAKVLSRYVDIIVLRTHSHQNLLELASSATIPVINGLTDYNHPCQVLADLVTVTEHRGDPTKLKIVYIGDGNNMANSWVEAACVLGLKLWLACPRGYAPSGATEEVLKRHPHIHLVTDPVEAVRDADVINTDTWFSMGQSVEQQKKAAFEPFQVNEQLLKGALPSVIVLHCLPAHRGEEITDGVMDGKNSVVFDQVENRLYIQMALIEALLKKRRR